jgi:hypothetical protein
MSLEGGGHSPDKSTQRVSHGSVIEGTEFVVLVFGPYVVACGHVPSESGRG